MGLLHSLGGTLMHIERQRRPSGYKQPVFLLVVPYLGFIEYGKLTEKKRSCVILT